MQRRSLHAVCALAALALVACSDDSDPAPTADPTALEPPPEGQGFQVSIEAEVPPFSELWLCDVYRMPYEGGVNVNRVEVKQTEGTHHLTLSTLGLGGDQAIAHGRYDCNELYGDSSLMENQVMFFGNQGSAHDELMLPPGIAAQLPPDLDVIHEIHFVNTSAEPLKIFSRVNAWTVPDSEVESGIWGGSVRDEHINIPAMTEHSEWSRCVFNEPVEILFLASHTHGLGKEFSIRPFNGETVGDVIYTNTDWHVPLITQYDPPIVVPAGEGFEWTCKWDNPNPEEVHYGMRAVDEMCNLAVVHTPFSVTARCEVVETSDGVLWDPDAG
jgi:hypothetical protein